MTVDVSELRKLLSKLPPIISRDRIDAFLGGIVSAKYLANLDSQGLGPPKFRIGRKIGYVSADLIEWLINRFEEVE